MWDFNPYIVFMKPKVRLKVIQNYAGYHKSQSDILLPPSTKHQSLASKSVFVKLFLSQLQLANECFPIDLYHIITALCVRVPKTTPKYSVSLRLTRLRLQSYTQP